jgi:arginase
MTLRVFKIPYDSGHRAERMGRGPEHLIASGLLHLVRDFDPDVIVVPIEIEDAFPTEIGSAFELHRKLAVDVATLATAKGVPIVLSGNCNSAIGTVAGLLAADPASLLGAIWFDGHGDCNTPETFTGNFLDAMGLSTLTGRCWQALCATIPGFRPLPDQNVILIGGHGADDGALDILANSQIGHVKTSDIERVGPSVVGRAVEGFRTRGIHRVYLHLDLDVIDARYARANAFAPHGGLQPDNFVDAIEEVASELIIAGVGIASYDPATDVDNRLPPVALRALKHVLSLAQ